jgi:hypothetical protein
MNDSKYVLYGAIFIALCLTVTISHCTYREGSCRIEAIKAGMKAEDVKAACRMG